MKNLDITLNEIYITDELDGFQSVTVELNIDYQGEDYTCDVQLWHGKFNCDCQTNGFDEIEDEVIRSDIESIAISKAVEFYDQDIKSEFKPLTLEQVKEFLIKDGANITADSTALDVESCFKTVEGTECWDDVKSYSNGYTIQYYKKDYTLYLCVENHDYLNIDATPYAPKYLAIKTYY